MHQLWDGVRFSMWLTLPTVTLLQPEWLLPCTTVLVCLLCLNQFVKANQV
jgi:hypothetical protein